MAWVKATQTSAPSKDNPTKMGTLIKTIKGDRQNRFWKRGRDQIVQKACGILYQWGKRADSCSRYISLGSLRTGGGVRGNKKPSNGLRRGKRAQGRTSARGGSLQRLSADCQRRTFESLELNITLTQQKQRGGNRRGPTAIETQVMWSVAMKLKSNQRSDTKGSAGSGDRGKGGGRHFLRTGQQPDHRNLMALTNAGY